MSTNTPQVSVIRLENNTLVECIRPTWKGDNLLDPVYRIRVAGRSITQHNLCARDLEKIAKLLLATIHSDFPSCYESEIQRGKGKGE